MTLKKLFLAHAGDDAPELYDLATELRVRGVVPWVDKQGGFGVADDSEAEARRAIREDCLGLLLYATPNVFASSFIRYVELDEARKVRSADPSFLLFAVPRGYGFRELKARSVCSFGVDLSAYHSRSLPQDGDLKAAQAQVAADVAAKVLRRSTDTPGTGSLSLQYSTREVMPDEPGDVLRIDATRLLGDGVGTPSDWDRLLKGLRDVKRLIAAIYGRPLLRIHGSKYLSSAFLFGRVFAPYEMDIRQTHKEWWRTDAAPTSGSPLAVSVVPGDPAISSLTLEIATGYKAVEAGVDDLIARGELQAGARLQLRPPGEAILVDEGLCAAMAAQVYRELDRVQGMKRVTEIHLFGAVPQSLMIMLGRAFKGMPKVHVYEWTGEDYRHAYCMPGGVL